MSDTHPNAFLAEAADTRLQAAALLGEAEQLEAQAARLMGQPVAPAAPAAAEPKADGFPVHEQTPAQPQAAPANATIPQATAPAGQPAPDAPKQPTPDEVAATAASVA